jgi:hypothetical protein
MVKMGFGEYMIRKFLSVLSVLILSILSACGGETTPTVSPEDLANTAIAQAWLAMTQTQAAQPTSTPAPPTATSEPTATFPPTLPVLPTISQATVASGPTQDVCNQVPPIEPLGTQVSVEIENVSGGSVNLAFGMSSPNDKNECVTYSFTLGRTTVINTKVLAGCYWGWGWVTGEEPSIAKTGSTILCLTDPNIIYKVVITEERVEFK